MSKSDVRIQRLQQIPVFALRQVMNRLIADLKVSPLVHDRFYTVLKRRPRNMKLAVQRMNREQLTKLVDACPEVTDDEIKELFEEYRYGSNPSFYIYLFNIKTLDYDTLSKFRRRFREALKRFNKEREEDGLPRIRRVALNDLTTLPDRSKIIEGNYRFQKRLEYIDENENALSTYETQYGFFWLNMADGYAIIHARNTDVLTFLKLAIEKGSGVYLTPLVISKQLKNTLPFLLEKSFRSGRLHDPDPDADHFRWLSVADDDPYAKGYKNLEQRYPEVRSARYREVVDATKKTSLTVRCDRGAFSLAGKLQASQFRAWSLDRLGQLISTLNQFREDPVQYVQTHNLARAWELAKFSAAQRAWVLEMLSALLTLKQSPQLEHFQLDASPFKLATAMERWIRLQIPLECDECDAEAYLACPNCESAAFRLKQQDETWQLECLGCTSNPWIYTLPIDGQCEQEHPFRIDEGYLADRVELLPSGDMVQAVSDVVKNRLPQYSFDPEVESFIVRGSYLRYYVDKGKIRDIEEEKAKTIIRVTQQIDQITGDRVEVVGVKVDQVTGSVTAVESN